MNAYESGYKIGRAIKASNDAEWSAALDAMMDAAEKSDDENEFRRGWWDGRRKTQLLNYWIARRDAESATT